MKPKWTCRGASVEKPQVVLAQITAERRPLIANPPTGKRATTACPWLRPATTILSAAAVAAALQGYCELEARCWWRLREAT